jgi:hypothetical protein
VALIHADDRHHVSCREALKKIRESLAIVWPAITEAMYLLGFSSNAQDALWQLLEAGALKILPLDTMKTILAVLLGWALSAQASATVRYFHWDKPHHGNRGNVTALDLSTGKVVWEV